METFKGIRLEIVFRILSGWLFCTIVISCGQPLNAITRETHSQNQVSLPLVANGEIRLPPQGMYDSCPPATESCLSHIDTLASKGFRLIVNYGQLYGNSSAQLAYADQAYRSNMQVIWTIPFHPERPDSWMIQEFSALAQESQCQENRCLIAFLVNLVKNHPATWGYYIGDEIPTNAYEKLQPIASLIHEIDAVHPRLVVTAGSNHPMEQYFGFYSYMRDLADVIGPDYYPYGYIDPGKQTTRYTGDTARHSQDWANQLGKESTLVLQAFSWARYSDTPLCSPWPDCAPFPTISQMKAQRDQALLNAYPALILWWTYEDILKTPNPDQTLQDLAEAAFSPVPSQAGAPRHPAPACPSPWTCTNIGNARLNGSLSTDENTWILKGSGWDIWTVPQVKVDQFFYAWQRVDQDLVLTARLDTQTSSPSRSKSGLMLRTSQDPGSPYYAVLLTPSSGLHIQYRKEYGGETTSIPWKNPKAPLYLKIERKGSALVSSVSEDGHDWRQLHQLSLDLSFRDGPLMAGMAVTSGDENSLQTTRFSHLKITLAAGQ